MNEEALCTALMQRLFVPIEASGRHVHLTEEAAQQLFGHGLTAERPLSQPGQFLCRERVSLLGPKGRFDRVAVLGPARSACQVEISLTDARTLGIDAPVRLSGSIDGSPGIVLETGAGRLELKSGVIVAERHLHLSTEEAERLKVQDGEIVNVRCFTARPVIFEAVPVRVHPQFRAALHLDYDEANACGFRSGDLCLICRG